ncbi:MAG: DUF3592 domain-containing protein [Candidatus Thiodiazotropha sp.]
MVPSHTNLLIFTAKLIALLCIAFLILAFFPHYAHHLLLVLAAALAISGAGSLLKYKSQRNWIESKADLLSCGEQVEEVHVSEYSKLKHYYPIIDYAYSVDGKSYTGNSASNEKENLWVPEVNSWGDPTPASDRWWSSLKPGDNVPVFINPRDHSEAVLVKDVTKARRSHHLALLIGGILIGLIWLALVFFNYTLPLP